MQPACCLAAPGGVCEARPLLDPMAQRYNETCVYTGLFAGFVEGCYVSMKQGINSVRNTIFQTLLLAAGDVIVCGLEKKSFSLFLIFAGKNIQDLLTAMNQYQNM